MLILYANLFLSDATLSVLHVILNLGVNIISRLIFHTHDTAVCCMRLRHNHKYFIARDLNSYKCLQLLCRNTLDAHKKSKSNVSEHNSQRLVPSGSLSNEDRLDTRRLTLTCYNTDLRSFWSSQPRCT